MTNFEQETKLQQATTEKVPALIGTPDSMDARHHERMFFGLAPLIAHIPEATWLTVGDGGADGWMIRKLGATKVTSSSISLTRLSQLKARGLLEGIELREINAEAIDLPDRAVDFILCKEAFHHLPHAPLAFYEFLRVARRGFVLIEPTELQSRRPLDILRTWAKQVLRRRPPVYEQFEPVGNFIYRVSLREVERALTATQSPPWFAVRTFNAFGTRWLTKQPKSNRAARAFADLGIGVQDMLETGRLIAPGYCALFVPVEPIEDGLKELLSGNGFRIVELPRCPYGSHDYTKSFL